MNCSGFDETKLLPLLVSKLSTTELFLMVLIESNNNNIVYRSRYCNKNSDGKSCEQCLKMFNNISHFHHIYLNQSCEQYSSMQRQTENKSHLSDIKGPNTIKYESVSEIKEESSDVLDKKKNIEVDSVELEFNGENADTEKNKIKSMELNIDL